MASTVDPAKRAEACGLEPGNVCRFLFERTESVGVAKAGAWLARAPLKIALVILLAYVLNRLVRRSIRRLAARIEGSASSGRLKRMRDRAPAAFLSTGAVDLRSSARALTVAAVLRSLCTAVIGTFTLVYVLEYLGLNLGPLLAGASVAGVAFGFGAQSLVKDFLSGIFMLIEDQYGVGDIVDVGEASGVVEAVSLRTTRLRDINGTVWHVPNGQILRVGNKSQQWARVVIDVSVAPNADVARATEVIGKAAATVWDEDEWSHDVLESPEVLGVEYLGPDAVAIRVIGKVRPGRQWDVSRAVRAEVARALGDAGIAMPPVQWLRAGTSSPP